MNSEQARQGERWAASLISLLLCTGALCALAYPLGEWLAGHGGVVALLVFVVFLAWWGQDWHVWMAERQQKARKKAVKYIT
jgi:L-lactate permease